jgi:protein TonB
LLHFKTFISNFKRDVVVKHRNLVSFLITTSFYLLLAGTYFYLQQRYILSDQRPQERVVHLSLANYVPQELPPVEEAEEPPKEEVVEPEPDPEPEPEPKPEPVIKEEPLPKQVIPEPVKPKVLPEPVPEKKEKKPEPKKKKPKKKRVKKKSKKRLSAQRMKGNPRRGVSKQESSRKNRFLAQIRQKINRNKSYPKIARRRGMQGVVKVRFTILANGNVGHIAVNGPKVFHRSAQNAVKRAFPVNTANVPISLPKSVNITLRYKLK